MNKKIMIWHSPAAIYCRFRHTCVYHCVLLSSLIQAESVSSCRATASTHTLDEPDLVFNCKRSHGPGWTCIHVSVRWMESPVERDVTHRYLRNKALVFVSFTNKICVLWEFPEQILTEQVDRSPNAYFCRFWRPTAGGS